VEFAVKYQVAQLKLISIAIAVALSVAPPGQAAESTLPSVDVVGSPDARARRPTSATVLDQLSLETRRVLSVGEALRDVPGIVTRDEEGFGLRPNIGIRGMNPTRSTKVLLLEDGLPAAYAPYGDNASYYHAPVDRYAEIEVLKGASMLRFGPQTISGAINYITPNPPERAQGRALLAGGSTDFLDAQLRLGGPIGFVDLIRKQGDGARDQQHLQQTDYNAKAVFSFGSEQQLVLRANRMDEDSQVSYSGITDAEWRNFGARYNPFKNDNFEIRRYGGSLTHQWQLATDWQLQTSVYGSNFDRDWWRQASTTTDTQCGNAFRDARLSGLAVNVDQCASLQGRLRRYYTSGVEPRLSYQYSSNSKLEFGVRAHQEVQERRQVNAASNTLRTGTVAEDNRRALQARAAFVSAEFTLGNFLISPVARFESIDAKRLNRLNNLGNSQDVSEFLPGLGVSFNPNLHTSIFANVHEGFAPPRVEDLIDNNGLAIDVDAERSRNAEIGLRYGVNEFAWFEASAFDNRFSNQIAVGSIAGGATPLAQARTQYRGLELAADFAKPLDNGSAWELYSHAAMTFLPTARADSPFIALSNQLAVAGSAVGNRLPYAPKQNHALRIGARTDTWDFAVEGQYWGDQYSDFANTPIAAANGNGQIGKIKSVALMNFTVNYRPTQLPVSFFVTVKNALGREYIVDRTRGILPGAPRQVIAGVQLNQFDF
jgi:Fe(3+) dicitrate transport protein